VLLNAISKRAKKERIQMFLKIYKNINISIFFNKNKYLYRFSTAKAQELGLD